MSFKVWLKANAADKALASLRQELIAQFERGASVLDIGCGTGDLLFRAADRIAQGFGIDLDQAMVDYATDKSDECGFSHLRFACVNALELTSGNYDVATSTLCLHEMAQTDALNVLKQMATLADRILIADYAEPTTRFGKFSIEFDEMISGHYSRFRHYRRAGRIPAYATACDLIIRASTPSSIDGIVIWELQGRATPQETTA